MGKGGKEKSGKEARKAAKAEQNRAREKGRRQRKLLDQKEVQSFGRLLGQGRAFLVGFPTQRRG